LLHADSRAPGLLIADDAQIAADVRFGAHVVVHPGVRIGAGCVIEDHAVLGKRPRLSASSTARGELEPLVLAERVTVCAGAIVFSGARVEADAIIGDQAFVRERTTVGPGSVIGRGSTVENDVRIGACAKAQTGAYITAYSEIEDDVFVGPMVVTTNDNTMSRHDPSTPLRGVTLRRACRVGGGSVLLPGVEVGEEAFVAAGAVVTVDVPPRAVVRGVPARVVGEVADSDLLEHWR